MTLIEKPVTSHRPHRPALDIEAAHEEIRMDNAILDDNIVSDACLRLFLEQGLRLDGTSFIKGKLRGIFTCLRDLAHE